MKYYSFSEINMTATEQTKAAGCEVLCSSVKEEAAKNFDTRKLSDILSDPSMKVVDKGQLVSEGRPMRVIVVEGKSIIGTKLIFIGVVGEKVLEQTVYLSNGDIVANSIETLDKVNEAKVNGLKEGTIKPTCAEITLPADVTPNVVYKNGDPFNLFKFTTEYCVGNLPKRGIKTIEAVVGQKTAFRDVLANAGFNHLSAFDNFLATNFGSGLYKNSPRLNLMRFQAKK